MALVVGRCDRWWLPAVPRCVHAGVPYLSPPQVTAVHTEQDGWTSEGQARLVPGWGPSRTAQTAGVDWLRPR